MLADRRLASTRASRFWEQCSQRVAAGIEAAARSTIVTPPMRRGQTRGMRRAFAEMDVFTSVPYLGNPLAVVLDGEGLSTEAMQQFANWTNFAATMRVVSHLLRQSWSAMVPSTT